MNSNDKKNRNIIIIDDNKDIHHDFNQILSPEESNQNFERLVEDLFEEEVSPNGTLPFETDSAFQGEEGFEMVKNSLLAKNPYALAFVDMRMPPGWDGMQTIENIWAVDPHIQIVLCTAYSDYSWDDIKKRIGISDRLLILKKPFDFIEVQQMAHTLTEKWNLQKQVRHHIEDLERIVAQRTKDLIRITQAVESSTEPIEITDLNGNYFFQNEAFTKLFGYSMDEINDREGAATIFVDKNLAQHIFSTIKGGNSWNGEVEMVGKNGKKIPIFLNANSVKDSDSNIIGFIGIHSDMSERKNIENILLSKESRLKKAQQLARVGSWEWNRVTNTFSMSEEMCRIFEQPSSDATIHFKSLIENLLHPDDAYLLSDLKVKTPFDFFAQNQVFRIKVKNSDVRWISPTKPELQKLLTGESSNIIVGIVQDITEQILAKEKIEWLAKYDSLTRLPNRTTFESMLSKEMNRVQRCNEKVSVLFIDLDHFKKINDTYGHKVGDILLKKIAKVIKGCLRNHDTASRYGGDEFVCYITQIETPDQPTKIVERIMNSFQKPFEIEEHSLSITPSIGIATYPDNNATDVESLIKQADAAMYIAKKSGKNTFRYCDSAMLDDMCRGIKLENDLNLALSKNEFELYYQPQIDINSRSVTGMEALLRWKHSKDGFISPGHFIPVAETTGQIIPISEWVIRNACMQKQAWLDAGQLPPFTVSVNISARHFFHDNLEHCLKRILSETTLGPEYLEIEITETAVVDDSVQTIKTLNILKDLGIHIALDDFGKGYSSLNYLRKLPLNKLKIDMSFVRDILTTPTNAYIVETIIKLAHKMNLVVVAEGIETKEQLDLLQSLHCDIAQGYFFSKPLPVDEVEKFLLQFS